MTRYYYRANAALTADLRAHQAERRRHFAEVVTPFVAAHPHLEPVQNTYSRTVLGFADGLPDQPPPAGLSRSQRRTYLVPARGRTGEPWREHLKRLNAGPRLFTVLERHGVPADQLVVNESRLYGTDWIDLGVCVAVFSGAELAAVALTPMKRSEFWTLYEAHQERGG